MPNYTNRYKTNQAADQQAAGLQLRKVELAEQTAADRENLSWQDLEFRQKKEAFDQGAKVADMTRQAQTKEHAAAALSILANIDPRDPDARLLAASAISRFPLAVGEEMVNKHYGLVIAGHEAANTAANEEALASGVDGRLPEFQIVDPKTGRWMGRDWRKYGEAITAAKAQKREKFIADQLKMGGGSGNITVKEGDASVGVEVKSPTDLMLENPTALPPEQQALGINSNNPTVVKQDIAAGLSRQAQAKADATKAATGVKRTAAAADLMSAVASYKTKTGVGDDDPVIAKLLNAAKALTEDSSVEDEPATPAAPTAKKLSPSAQKAIDELNRLNPPTK